jgi:hypothetical protein
MVFAVVRGGSGWRGARVRRTPDLRHLQNLGHVEPGSSDEVPTTALGDKEEVSS